ncbi:H-type lectin domain-containing protein [Tateyamaria armeniaca]|uniref:H-type lectin domain-containing protein n=1 Tax=Tateyamaria armeniaca TaxID=2518930 RepID=A0ABW8UTR6_9RHOB
MKRLENHLIGIDQGDAILFSDFEDGGEMWTGRGQRERRRRVAFSEEFRVPPSVHVSISMWDVDTKTALRADVSAELIDAAGFDLVFRTWGDTRVARVRVAWMAMGEVRQPDEWDLY